MKKELKSGILSAGKSADGRPTVGGVNVIAVLLSDICTICLIVLFPFQKQLALYAFLS